MKMSFRFRLPSSLLLSLALAAAAFAGEVRIHGFFVQPELGYAATDYQSFSSQSEWNAWMKQMADLGAEMVFYQWTVSYQRQADIGWYIDAYHTSTGDYAFYTPGVAPMAGPDGTSYSVYSWGAPTTWPGTVNQPGGKESVDYLLDAAAANGMKAWLGLYLCEKDFCNWWDSQDIDDVIDRNDSVAIEWHVQRSIQVAQDLLAKYGDHAGFGGLYMSVEPANITFMGNETRKVLASAIDRVAKAAHAAKPGVKVSICPFFNTSLSSAEEFGSVWEYVIENSDLDVLMLQDGVGVEPQTLTASEDLVSPWYAALRRAANKKGIEFWGNSELFTNLGTRLEVNLIPSTMEKIRMQLTAEAGYVDKFVCFAFSYLDPTKDPYNFSQAVLGSKYAENRAQRAALYDSLKAYWQEWQLNPVVDTSFTAARPAPRVAPMGWTPVPGGAVVHWNAEPAQWRLFDASGRQVASGVVERGENALGWGPVVPGRYLWRAGNQSRSVNSF